MEELSKWVKSEFGDFFYSDMTSAGQDGRTVRMVARPGITIPILMHMKFDDNSIEPDQVMTLLYLKNQWYEIPGLADAISGNVPEGALDDSALIEFLENELIEGILSGKKLGDIARSLTFEIKGGDINEITSDGLEAVVLPEPSDEIVSEEMISEPYEPGPKSRPKLD